MKEILGPAGINFDKDDIVGSQPSATEKEIIDAFGRIGNDPDFQAVIKQTELIGSIKTVEYVFDRIAIVTEANPESGSKQS